MTATIVRAVCARSAWRTILADVVALGPREACGLLVGACDESDTLRILRAVPVANLAVATDRFELDPRGRLSLQRRLREEEGGLTVVGLYHSHPEAPPVPSSVDFAWAEEEGLLWLIVSPTATGGRVGAFFAVPGPGLRAVPFRLI